MRTARLKIPEAARRMLAGEGYAELWPPQAAAVRAGVTRGRSVLVSAPTASGKTLTAMLAMIGYLSRAPGRAVYLSPLRALASEKYAEFKKLEGPLGVRVGVSTGDPGSAGRNLDKCRIIILTNERMDSLLRRGAQWTSDIGLVIADEIHLVGDVSRGPTLEMVLARLARMEPAPQVVGLSATVSNPGELARWLGCKMVESDWRPVRLEEGVCTRGLVTMGGGREFEVKSTISGTAIDLGAQCVAEGGQALVFAPTRPRSRSLATKAAAAVSRYVRPADARRLERAAEKILAENEKTDLVRALAGLVPSGVAFHHAGLGAGCRKIIEDEFRRGGIRLLASTPTLAAGINLPARRVVISSIYRYDARLGVNAPISILEYKQFCGRAGRPQYDEYGEAIIVDDRGMADLADHYMYGDPEPVESHIVGERPLRMHALGVIASDPGITEGGLQEFFAGTFGGGRARGRELAVALGAALGDIVRGGLAELKGKRYAATRFGRAASSMYLDPDTAVSFRDALEGASPGDRTLGYLHVISSSDEFYPRFALRQRDYEAAYKLLDDCRSELLGPLDINDCSRSLLALYAWVSEWTELQMSERLGVESGDMHRMRETASWLASCMREVARVSNRPDLLSDLGALESRMKNGVRPELLELVRVRGVGRIRARGLYRHGIRNLGDLRRAPVRKLAEIDKIGPALASSIKAGLGKMR